MTRAGLPVRCSRPPTSGDDWTAVQVVSELATNAVVHARTTFTVKIDYDDAYIKVSVIDAKPLARAAVRWFSDTTTTGRGLAAGATHR